MNLIVEISGVYKTYTYQNISVPALRGVNLEVGRGEIISIFGRSGSGKSTLLNLLGGLDYADDGEITVGGVSLSCIKNRELSLFRRKSVGFVFQHFNLVPYLDALDNVCLPLKYHGVPQKIRREKAMNILKEVGLEDRRNFTLSHLSGGQIQRVAFARASVMEPAIILADEPTGQLDTHTSKELADMIKSMNKKKGQTFIIATHDPVFREISHRTLILEDGRFQND